MANLEQVARLRAGAKAWNEWRKASEGVLINLSRADLAGANLSGANLNNAILSEANLAGANLSNTNLHVTNLIGADLRQANLRKASLTHTGVFGANLENADLTSAYLVHADLSEANLNGAALVDSNLRKANFSLSNLREADFTGSELYLTVFGNSDLRDAKGLIACKHAGPSVLDYLTLAKSGTLPPEFLRGCGLPDSLIRAPPSLLNQAIQFYSCFISYSTRDEEFAERIHADLQNRGVRCWFAPHDIAGGKKVHEQIDEAIRLYDRLLLVLSDHSMRSSWVETEISKARKRELREKRRMLFPVRLVNFESLQDWECFDADTSKDSAREIREYFIPDFSNWKDHDSYKEAFERLLRDLKADETETQGA